MQNNGLHLDEVYEVVESAPTPEQEMEQDNIGKLGKLESALSKLEGLVQEDPFLIEYLETVIATIKAKIGFIIRNNISPEALAEYELEKSFKALFGLSEKLAVLTKKLSERPTAAQELDMESLGKEIDRLSAKIGADRINRKIYEIVHEILMVEMNIEGLISTHSPDEDVLREAADLETTGDQVAELRRKSLTLSIHREVLTACLAKLGEI